MLVIVTMWGTRTGRVGTFSTTGLAVVAAAIRPVLELDGVVLGSERQFLQKREIRTAPVVHDVAGVGAIAHRVNLVRDYPVGSFAAVRFSGQLSTYLSWLTRYATWSGPYDDHTL